MYAARYEFLCTKVHVRNVIYRERSLGERVQGQMLERCSEVLCSWCVASFAECCQTHGYPDDAHIEKMDKETEREIDR